MAKIGAVLLAAGSSVRFGADNKLLADIGGRTGGRPLIRSVAEAIIQGDIVSEIVVVTGYDQPLIERALHGLRLRFINNPNWPKGMGSSIAIGASALGSSLDGAFIIPGDMPLVPAAVLERLIEEFVQAQGASIIFPATASGAQRNPVLWPRRFFAILTSLSGLEGGKRSLNALAEYRNAVLVADDSVFTDIDTAEDLALAHSRFGRVSTSGPT
jgi:molybdenum cofactor cytidylyltransferase